VGVTPLDVSGLPEPARTVAAAAGAVYVRHTSPWFVGLVGHGSAFKGGVVSGSSDLDLLLYLTADAFDANGVLPWPLVRALYVDLAAVDPAPFAYVQCAVRRAEDAEPLNAPWWLLAGTCPAREATADEVRSSAARTLALTHRALTRVPEALLDHGSGRLAREMRLLATDVWPTVYALLARDAEDPRGVWALPKPAAIAALAEPLRGLAGTFHERLLAYHANGTTVADALAALDAGLAFLAQTQ
jgi:hypothetical protein